MSLLAEASLQRVLTDILVVLVAAKLAAEVAERVNMPAVVGEIAAGLLIGPSLLGIVEGGEVLRVLAELGVILLLLQVGMETDLAELGAVGRASVQVAVVGVALPFAGGTAVMLADGRSASTAIFVGAALTATSVGITARVFGDLRALATVEARTVLGAAVADDVLGLVILTVVVRIAAGGSVSLGTVAGVLALAVMFLLVTGTLGVRLTPHLFHAVHRLSRSPGTLVAIALAFTLVFAALADTARLAPIVGAFVAGISLGRSAQAERIQSELTPVGHLFIPVFFLQIGIDANVRELIRPEVLLLAGGLLAVAIAGKLGSAAGVIGLPADKLLIGLGMLPRGEVGLIFAGIGLREGLLGENLYASLLLVVLSTTLIAPPLLRWRLVRVRASRRAVTAAPTPMPEGGWLRTSGGEVALTGRPPPYVGLHLALQAAVRVGRARPRAELLQWFAELGEDTQLRWDAAATRELFELLRHGNARSWRFLETTGILERVLPELADALRRRRADASELDPVRVMRWALVERIHDLAEGVAGVDPIARREHQGLAHPQWLLLAALILEAAGPGESPIQAARRLVQRLELGAAAEQEVALLVGESGLLRAAAARPDALDEETVLQLAAHLELAERARALYILSLALGDLEPWDRRHLDDLHELVQAVLARPELSGREARNLAEQRRGEARRLVDDPAVHERLEHAPRGYLLSQSGSALARQAALLEPLPSRGTARVRVMDENGRFRVEVASRDQHGLLSRISGVLASFGLDVVDAVIATWPDGGALESFSVMATARPDADKLRDSIVEALRAPLAAPPVEARVSYDDDGSPWYTLCRVEAPDRPALLHALTTAFASAGASVHSARISTREGKALDTFELTDGRGAKLDEGAKTRIAAALAYGVETRRRLRGARGVATSPKQSRDNAETKAP